MSVVTLLDFATFSHTVHKDQITKTGLQFHHIQGNVEQFVDMFENQLFNLLVTACNANHYIVPQNCKDSLMTASLFICVYQANFKD